MKKNKNDKYKTIFRVVIIIIVMIASINFVYLQYEENILNNEVKVLTQKEFKKDEYNTSLKTFSNYKRVEIQIKNYLVDYSEKTKRVYKYIDDEKLKSVLSANNYAIDGKAFVNTTEYLNQFEIDFNKEIDDLIDFSEEKVIMSYIDKENISNYFKNVYHHYMFDSSLGKKIVNDKKELKNKKKTINNLVNNQRKVIEFLKSSSSWTVKDNKIIFSSEDDLKKYNELIKDIS